MSIQITQLTNGLRVVTDIMPDAESVVVGAWVGVGTRHEPWAASGVAHLVEHMMFKGTKQRSYFDISAAVEKNGGSMNAHTSREETAYYARALPEDAALATDLIADMLQHSVFNPKELDRERQVIIQEIGRDLDTPEDHVFDLLHSTAYPRQTIGRSILGSAKVIAKLPRREVTSYVKQHYHAGNMVVVAAGKITHEQMVQLARKYFGKLPAGKKTKTKPAKSQSGVLRLDKETEQLHLMMAFPGPGLHTASVYAATLLGIVLGGSSSSRLFQKVREERGLVYSISANHMPFNDTGLFSIYAGTDPARVKELMPVMCRELRDVTHRITTAELKRAKAQIRADMLMGQESVMRRAEVLGHHMLAYGKPIPIKHVLSRMEAVTTDDVQAIATKLLSKKPIVAALGPLGQLENYQKTVERLSN